VKSSGLGIVDKAVLSRQIEYVVATAKPKTTPVPDAIYNDKFLPPQAERMPIAK
jgi:hypothetical protein